MKLHYFCNLVILSLLSAVSSGCDVLGFDKNNSELVPTLGPQKDGRTIDDRTDEEKPPFVDVPSRYEPTNVVSTPTAPNTNTEVEPGTQPTAPIGDGTGSGYGVFGNLSCEQYVAQFWKVGASTHEEAPGPLFTKLTFDSKVLSVSGTMVTLSTKLETGSPADNVNEQITFDACNEPEKSAIPTNAPDCSTVELGTETITVQGKQYNTKKTKIGMCNTTSGKTYQSIVWRAAELPLWGVLKRELTGSIVPAILNGKIAPTTVQWNF